MMRFCAALLLSCLASAAWAVCPNSKLGTYAERSEDVIIRQVRELLSKNDFAELDRLAKEYEDMRAVTSDGKDKLSTFFYAVATLAPHCTKDAAETEKWNEHKKTLLKWEAASRHPIAPKLALARFESRLAWRARGPGFASSVTPEGWVLFRQHMKAAKSQLEKIRVQGGNHPMWYSDMLRRGLEGGWNAEKFEALHKTAIKRFPHYFPLYDIKATYYSQRWHGSTAVMKAYIEKAASNMNKRDGDILYARLHASNYMGDMFKNGQADWSRMRAGLEQLVQKYPDNYNRNLLARFACSAEDRTTLKSQFQLIRDQIILEAWHDKEEYQYCKDYAALEPGKNCFRRMDNNEIFCEDK